MLHPHFFVSECQEPPLASVSPRTHKHSFRQTDAPPAHPWSKPSIASRCRRMPVLMNSNLWLRCCPCARGETSHTCHFSDTHTADKYADAHGQTCARLYDKPSWHKIETVMAFKCQTVFLFSFRSHIPLMIQLYPFSVLSRLCFVSSLVFFSCGGGTVDCKREWWPGFNRGIRECASN